MSFILEKFIGFVFLLAGVHRIFLKEQIGRTSFKLPTLKIEDEVKWKEGDCLPYYSVSDFSIENYQSHPAIKMPLSN